ncbi:hypothetical protein D9M71_442550 [compost metagenome]
MRPGLGTGFSRADALQLYIEHRVGRIVEDDRGDVEPLARHGPQGLNGVHRGAIADQRQHWSVGAGNGRADGIRQALPDGPAGEGDEIVARRSCRHRRKHQPGGDGFVDQDGVLRQQVADRLAHLGRGQFAAWATRTLDRLQEGSGLSGAECGDQFFQAGGGVLRWCGEGVDPAAFGRQIALLAGVGEEGHRRLGVHQNQFLDLRQLHTGHLGHVGDAFDWRQSSAALHARGEYFGE